MKRWIVGIDVGGTKIAASLGTIRGLLVAKRVLSSRGGAQSTEVIGELCEMVRRLLNERKLKPQHILGVGLAVAGAIDTEKGVILKSPNLKRWERIPLKKILSRSLHMPVFIENDANAAAVGEHYFGSGRGVDHFLYVTVSTGIGSGIIANGVLVRGTSGTAGELGHITVVPGGNKCQCGKQGCLEAYASGTAIADAVKRALRKGAKSRYFNKIRLNRITGKDVTLGALHGDRLAVRVRETAADYLGIGLANVVNLLNPRCIILGGGVVEKVDHFWHPMLKALKREAWPMALARCRITRSKLGSRVGDLGALAVVLSACRNSFE